MSDWHEVLPQPTIEHPGKIDLGCGDNKREGFFGIDKFKTASTDAECDLLKFPWPLADASVDEAHCSNFFEHVPAAQRKPFMEELHRVMKPGAKATFITPMGDRMSQDPTHQWPPIVPGSYLYFNQGWLKDNKLTHGDYVTTADFDYSYGYGLHPAVAARNAEFQQYAIQFYNNAASDLHVTLTRK
jgi:SAM-dependent methyltransferase